MLLDPLRRALLAFLRVSQAPPEAPGGEHVEVFRASPRYLSYLLLAWALQSAFMILVMGGAVTGATGKASTWAGGSSRTMASTVSCG